MGRLCQPRGRHRLRKGGLSMKTALLLIALFAGFVAAGTSDYQVAQDMATERIPILIATDQP